MNAKEARELTIASARKLPKYEQEREKVSPLEERVSVPEKCVPAAIIRPASCRRP